MRMERKRRRALLCLLALLLAASLCRAPAAAAEEPSDEMAAVLNWLRDSVGWPDGAEEAELTAEQLDALRQIFVPDEDASEEPEPALTVYAAALRLINGEFGTDEECRERLEAAGLDYWSVRHMANALLQGYDQIAQDVLDGLYGRQAERFRALAQRGYDAKLVQQIVNGMLES